MPFCIHCGLPTLPLIPAGDSRVRQVCESCGHIHYENPKIICGALLVWQDKVLLCRRAIEPRYGLWTLPAGFMENGETIAEGAARESQEEAEAVSELEQLYCIYNIPDIGQVYMLYRGMLVEGNFGVGEESLECGLFSEADIPWELLAFESIRRTLKHFFADRQTGHFGLHIETLRHPVKPT